MLLAGSLFFCLGLYFRGPEKKEFWTSSLSAEIEIIGLLALDVCLGINHPYLLAAGIYEFLELTCT